MKIKSYSKTLDKVLDKISKENFLTKNIKQNRKVKILSNQENENKI